MNLMLIAFIMGALSFDLLVLMYIGLWNYFYHKRIEAFLIEHKLYGKFKEWELPQLLIK